MAGAAGGSRWVAGGGVLYQLSIISDLFGFLLVVVAAFSVLTVVASFVRFHLFAQQMERGALGSMPPEEVFRFRVVQQLGALHQTPAPFSILLIEPVPLSAGGVRDGEWLSRVAEQVRARLRRGDVVSLYSSGRIAVLGRFGYDRIEPVARRLAGAPGKGLYQGLTVGAIAFPQHGARAQDLLERAEVALDTARAQGAGRVHYPAPEGDLAPAGAPAAAAPRRDTRGLLDEGTGVLREERFGMALHKVVARQRLAEQPVSVVVLAIDQLDQVEQRYGRAAADQLLKIVADLLSEGTRELDLLARSGPAGFALSMDCAPEQALVAARRMASAARQLPAQAGATHVRITLSGGVAGYPEHTGQARQMWRYAQAALVAAQARGRNLILPFAADMELAAEPAQQGVDVF